MRRMSVRATIAFGLTVGALGAAAFVAACSSSSSSGAPGGNGNDSGNGDGSQTPQGSCKSPTIPLAFTPMYSAFIPGSTAHSFQIPAVAVNGGTFTWSASDPTMVDITADPTTGGVMLTVKNAGKVTIIATAGDGTCGASELDITSALETDWATGNARYNDGNGLRFGPPDGGGRRDGGGRDGGGFPGLDAAVVTPDAGPACTNCHGPTATSSVFKDVSHTPEQTGGFTDQELIDIVVNGVVPDGGYFDPNVIIPDASADPVQSARAYQIWHSFHQWTDIGPDQQLGIVVYLRSITPAPQDGTSNFPPRGPRDGGRRDGAGNPPDAAGQDAAGD
jgi:Bacterial Ig-like domain (group 2)